MILAMFACLNKKVSDEKVVEQVTVTKTVYRDELTKMRSPVLQPNKAVVKKSVRFADPEPSILGEEKKKKEKEKELVKGELKEGIRVKLKMTREEAARLLSKCKEGGVLEFNDVARELVALPLNRVSVVSTLHER